LLKFLRVRGAFIVEFKAGKNLFNEGTELRNLPVDFPGLKSGFVLSIGLYYFIIRIPFGRRDSVAATDVRTIYRLADVARKELNYVYTGNC
jgi:hypothetical protein